MVTAFYDLGRGEWKGFKRSADDYFNTFANLAKMENDMVVFVANEEHKERVLKLRENRKTTVIVYDLIKEKADLIKRVKEVLFNPDYRAKVLPELIENGNIEYFHAEYNVVNFAKTFFVNYAIENNLTEHEQIAWVDFGIDRDGKFFAGLTNWKYDFTPDKINFFNIVRAKYIPPFNTEEQVFRFMYENIVYICGGVIAGNKKAWQEFNAYLYPTIDEILAKNVIDDDQGIYIYCYWKRPDLFKVRYVGARWKIENIVKLNNQNTFGYKVRQILRKLSLI
ncbi:hypothetical protein CJP74_00475 [Psittacicella melopsittaci]|uniref:Protein YibB n=2 Tax=Psittacicella melopsittaci TaxID=2028576 RepID=A0A3A1Y6Q2_9GAMM|nr:hypothetical protein CJP74_00475 [Psittacicella melopsittaci]